MVVLLSDVHLSDGSSGHFHLTDRAFEEMFRKVQWLAREVKAKSVEFVLLGDIFDMIHTDHWVDIPTGETPWGSNPEKWKPHARKLLCKIIGQKGPIDGEGQTGPRDESGPDNQAIFESLKNASKHFESGVAVTVTYVPGNHDRICNLDEEMCRTIRQTLALKPEEGESEGSPFRWHYVNGEHRIFAYHGCQLDGNNWEGHPDVEPSADEPPETPIGDVVTAMVASKVPGRVLTTLEERDLIAEAEQKPKVDQITEADAEQIVKNCKEVFDVRPLVAALPFLSRQVGRPSDKPEVCRAVQDAMSETIREYCRIPLAWRWCNLKLTAALLFLRWLLRWFPVFALDRCPWFVEWIVNRFRQKPTEYYSMARRRVRTGEDGKRVDYVVAGHTHTPLERAILSDEGRECLYVNTGTWRPRYEETFERGAFVAMKGLTYVVIYASEETKARGRTVETWTGMLKDRDVNV